jgi:hypothetical protein
MNNNNQDKLNQELSESSNQLEDSTFAKYGEGLSSARVVELRTQDDVVEFEHKLRQRLLANDGMMDKTTESWLDSEFNRIYVAYAYPDVTKVN